MTQLRIVWSSNGSDLSLPGTKRKPAKCGLRPTPSSKSPSVSRKFARLQRQNPTAAAVIEKWVDQALEEESIRLFGTVLE